MGGGGGEGGRHVIFKQEIGLGVGIMHCCHRN